MEFDLHYVRGINLLDTPRFEVLEEQREFFEDHRVLSVLSSYYPPFYTNKIRFEVSMLPLDTVVNYLSFVFSGKRYFYFIEKINYINENLIELAVVMDVIQTYMFDIDFISVDMDRVSIKRWKPLGMLLGDAINRDYVRENISNETSVIKRIDTLETDYAFYLVEAVSDLITGSTLQPTVCDGGEFTNSLYYYILPVYKPNFDISRGSCEVVHNDTPYYFINHETTLNDLATNVNVLTIKRLENFSLLEEWTIDGNRITIPNNNASVVSFGSGNTEKLIFLRTVSKRFSKFDYEFDFVKNNNIDVPRSYKFVPQLLDENYFSYKFGEKIGYTSYPLHKLDYPKIYNQYMTDIFSGSRLYKTLGVDEGKDLYLTTIQNQTIEQLTLKTNPWKEYISRNSATLTSGVKLAKQNAIVTMATGMLGAGLGQAQTEYNIREGIKNPNFTGGVLPSSSSVPNISLAAGSVIAGGMALYNIDKRLGITKENLQFAPDTVKQGNSASSDVFGDAVKPLILVEQVKDLEDCALAFETFGYKVHDILYNTNIFDYYNTRYYYNIVKVKNCEISLNLLNSEDIIQAIKERLSNGLRLWNVTSNSVVIGDFTYDNVEKDFLEEV